MAISPFPIAKDKPKKLIKLKNIINMPTYDLFNARYVNLPTKFPDFLNMNYFYYKQKDESKGLGQSSPYIMGQ